MISSILLAAGQSLRMKGENKLVKEIYGVPLIKYAVKNILASTIDELIIVLGHDKDLIENIIGINKKIKFAYNKDFKNGISSSIKTGLNHVSKKSDAFFISLGDMPSINQNIYNKLIKSRFNYNKKLKPKYKKEIIIPTFEGKNGNPVLISKYAKEKMNKINGDIGAKEIIELNKNKTLYIPVKSKGVTLDFDYLEDFSSS